MKYLDFTVHFGHLGNNGEINAFFCSDFPSNRALRVVMWQFKSVLGTRGTLAEASPVRTGDLREFLGNPIFS